LAQTQSLQKLLEALAVFGASIMSGLVPMMGTPAASSPNASFKGV
jgi:hypothetical protein